MYSLCVFSLPLRVLQHETASVKLVPTLPLAILPPRLPPKKIFLTSLKFQMLTHSLDLAWEVRELLTLYPLLFFLLLLFPTFLSFPPPSPSHLPLLPTFLPIFLFLSSTSLSLSSSLLPSLVDRFTYHTHSHRVCRVWRAHPNHPVTARPGPSLAPLLFFLFTLSQATHLRVHEQVRQVYPPYSHPTLPSPLHSSTLCLFCAGVSSRTVSHATTSCMELHVTSVTSTSLVKFLRYVANFS